MNGFVPWEIVALIQMKTKWRPVYAIRATDECVVVIDVAIMHKSWNSKVPYCNKVHGSLTHFEASTCLGICSHAIKQEQDSRTSNSGDNRLCHHTTYYVYMTLQNKSYATSNSAPPIVFARLAPRPWKKPGICSLAGFHR